MLSNFSKVYNFIVVKKKKKCLHLSCDYSEEEVTIIGATTFSVTEIVTTTSNLSKPLM